MIECLSAVSTTLVKNLLAVLLIPVNGLLGVSLTPVINVRLFGHFLPVSMSPGKNVIAGINDTGNELL